MGLFTNGKLRKEMKKEIGKRDLVIKGMREVIENIEKEIKEERKAMEKERNDEKELVREILKTVRNTRINMEDRINEMRKEREEVVKKKSFEEKIRKEQEEIIEDDKERRINSFEGKLIQMEQEFQEYKIEMREMVEKIVNLKISRYVWGDKGKIMEGEVDKVCNNE